MEKYIGTKVVEAKPFTLGEYIEYSGRNPYMNSETVHCTKEEGYLVKYQDGYESWSPKDTFEKAYKLANAMSFGNAIVALKNGDAVRRTGWNGKGMFVVKQVPASISSEIIPKMQSLPERAKELLLESKNRCINYTNQMLLIQADGRADSWVPSSSDVFAEDWEIVK